MTSVFLCHASEDKPIVEPIQLALTGAGYKVFYDEQSLPPGGDYHEQIHAAIKMCDLFVFIASPNSIREGKFTLTEVKFVRERWPTPVKRVLPVISGGLLPRDLPAYLQAASVLTIKGNAAAEVRATVKSMISDLSSSKRRLWASYLVISGFFLAFLSAAVHIEIIDFNNFNPFNYQFFQIINNGPKKQQVASEILKNLNTLIESWGRLIAITNYEVQQLLNSQELSAEEQRRKLDYVKKRDDAKISLYSAIAESQLYFSDETTTLLVEFQKWNDQQGIKTINELPTIDDWKKKQEIIISQLKSEVRQ